LQAVTGKGLDNIFIIPFPIFNVFGVDIGDSFIFCKSSSRLYPDAWVTSSCSAVGCVWVILKTPF